MEESINRAAVGDCVNNRALADASSAGPSAAGGASTTDFTTGCKASCAADFLGLPPAGSLDSPLRFCRLHHWLRSSQQKRDYSIRTANPRKTQSNEDNIFESSQ